LDVEDAVLRDDEEVAVGGVEGFVLGHVFARRVDEISHACLGGGVAVACDEVQGVHPVYCLIQVEGVPSELVWDEVDLFPGLVLGVCVESFGFAGFEVAVPA
jgi:hypothetical protein